MEIIFDKREMSKVNDALSLLTSSKIIDINKTIPKVTVPLCDLGNYDLSILKQTLYSIIDEIIASYQAAEKDIEVREFVSDMIAKLRNTLLIKELLKKHQLDEFFFIALENIFIEGLKEEDV
jgi:hypothetical protein